MHLEESIDIAAPREAVWNLISHTDRLNRESGLPPVNFEFQARPTAGTSALATVTIAGVTLSYREHPFQWSKPEYYSVKRTFQAGPIAEIECGTKLTSTENGTRVTTWGEITPASRLVSPICVALGKKVIRDVLSACRGFDAFLARGAATPYPRHSSRPPADRARLLAALERLCAAGADEGHARRLAEHVKKAPPDMVLAIRPFVLADSWGMDRIRLLETCLIAARTGMLDLQWRILCPHCKGGRATPGGLSGVSREAHCESCNIHFDAEFDRNVEVVFSVTPAIRPVKEQTYCVGGPGLAAHADVQCVLPPNGNAEANFRFGSSAYRLTSLNAHRPLEIHCDRVGADAITVQLCEVEGKAEFVASESVVSPHCRWRFENGLDEEAVVRLETKEHGHDTATAALVTSLQAFRDQFSSEVLSPGSELAVRQVCILFSDLKGSTAMYRRQGDAPSYREVREHFTHMQAIIARHHGAVVKTIGDAIMATFHDPAKGLAAAIEIQQHALKDPTGLVIKLGIHWGPALAVNTDGVLDYFGQTVNLAARLQNESHGGDVVLAANLCDDPMVDKMIAACGFTAQPFQAVVRGIDEPIDMLRLVPTNQQL